ncbi:hypothetical protein V6Z11_D12G154900 [Gossypium hirsutum]
MVQTVKKKLTEVTGPWSRVCHKRHQRCHCHRRHPNPYFFVFLCLWDRYNDPHSGKMKLQEKRIREEKKRIRRRRRRGKRRRRKKKEKEKEKEKKKREGRKKKGKK